MASNPKIVLKARATGAQLADRLRPPVPEGIEIYLDGRDIAEPNWLETLTERMACLPRGGFAILVEGPIRSLDGRFFDLTADGEANRAVVDRLTTLGRVVGAQAACVHLIAPTDDLGGVESEEAERLVDACLPLTRYYAARCTGAGIVPTVENVPPVARMREARLMTSPIGGPPEHLSRLADRVDGLRFTVDTSHAQLFLNAANAAGCEGEFAALTRSAAASSRARSMADFLAPLRGRIETVHVSDAEGLLGEGLPYGQGAMDLDSAVDLLLPETRWVVTEILEPDPDRSEAMREAWRRIAARRDAMAEVVT